MRQFNHLQKLSGTAIFMALLVVSIVTTITVIWFTQTQLALRRTQQMLISEQVYLYAEGVLNWGISALMLDDTAPKILLANTIKVPGGYISGRIDDYQSESDYTETHAIHNKYAMTNQPKEYFILRADAYLTSQHLVLYSLLHRKTINGKIVIGIIWQSQSFS